MPENEKLVERLMIWANAGFGHTGERDARQRDEAEAAPALTLAQARIRELEGVLAARSAEPVAWCSEGALKMAAAGVPAIIHAYPPPVDPVALYRHPKEAPDV